MRANRWDAIIFDYGRVLSHSPSEEEIAAFAAMVGVTNPPFWQLYSDTRDEYDSGRHDSNQHWQRFADAAGIALTPGHIARIVDYENRLWLRENLQVLDLAREIRACGMRTAILSNMPPDLLEAMRESFDWLGDFEIQVWSCEHGVIKPHPAIYQLCLEKLGCEPHRTLFFDDRPRNVEGARKLGMEAHVFESAQQARDIIHAGLSHG